MNEPERTPRRENLQGPRGLILSIIAQAARDLNGTYGREAQLTAHLYFQSQLYRDHCDWLDLDPDAYPMGLDPAPTVDDLYQTLRRGGGEGYLRAYLASSDRGLKILAEVDLQTRYQPAKKAPNKRYQWTQAQLAFKAPNKR